MGARAWTKDWTYKNAAGKADPQGHSFLMHEQYEPHPQGRFLTPAGLRPL